MKTEEGSVVSVLADGMAEVKVGRHNDCIACGACPGAENITVIARNVVGAKIGQRVEFEVREVNVVIGAFVCFVMPLIIAALGVFIGRWVSNPMGYDMIQSEIVGGIAGFLIGVVGVKLFDRSLSKAEEAKPKITAIIS